MSRYDNLAGSVGAKNQPAPDVERDVPFWVHILCFGSFGSPIAIRVMTLGALIVLGWIGLHMAVDATPHGGTSNLVPALFLPFAWLFTRDLLGAELAIRGVIRYQNRPNVVASMIRGFGAGICWVMALPHVGWLTTIAFLGCIVWGVAISIRSPRIEVAP